MFTKYHKDEQVDDLIPRDLCDTDTYKLSMGQVVFNQFPHAIARYSYTNRAVSKVYPKGFAERLREQFAGMKDLRFTSKMHDYFKLRCPWLKETYLQWLRGYRFDSKQIKVSQDANGQLDIEIEGPWFETIFWEVPILYIVTQLSRTDPNTGSLIPFAPEWREKIRDKAVALDNAGVNWIDFGTRRRASYSVQEAVVEDMRQHIDISGKFGFRGTSNPYLAMKFNIQAFGTFAHELPMAMQAIYGIPMSNKMAMEHWVKEYRGDLGIALTDTLTTASFLNDFDTYYAKLFDGVRQDGGDAKVIGDMVIDHYKKLRINPLEKIIVFSDSLNVEKVIMLQEYFKGRIKTTFGIGTNLTNDVGWLPSNHVIKLTEIDFGKGFIPLVKISDNKEKNVGKIEMIDFAMKSLRINA